MRHLIMFTCLIMASNLVAAQTSKVHDPINDPTYSLNNYKHPNKAAYARKHNLDKSQELKTVEATDNRDYKHPGNNQASATSASIATSKPSSNKASYKHPYGL